MWCFGSCLRGWRATHAQSQWEGQSVELAAGLPSRPHPLQTLNPQLSSAPLLTDLRVGVGHGPPGGEPVSFNET